VGAVVGIDLGTTNTVVAVAQGGQAAAIADEDGHKLIPSVVSFHPNGNVLVGRPAKERRLVDAANTIYSVKRLIGRSWDSEEVRTARARFPFEMREGPGQAALVVARGETYTLPEISAFVLRKAKAVAETALGESVDRAVITVPANFNDLQRAATKVAGRVAGLEVLRILNEPTAAALAYGYGRSPTERLAVYDFGGGTFDITLLDLSDNVFEVLATAGNTFLGGDDIDLAIAEKMADRFLAQHRYDPREHASAFERLRIAAEGLKQRLSVESDVTIEIAEVAHGPAGRALGLGFRMTRAELERLVSPIVERSFDVCRDALLTARAQASDFAQVLLVGGSTRIPLVRRQVEEFFRCQVQGHISPDEVVAIGAAIQAAALTGAERRRADIPQPPNPAARGADAGGGRRIGTLPRGASRPRLDSTAGFAPATQPFSRERIATSPGIPPGSRGDLPRTDAGPAVPMPVFAPGRGGQRPRVATGSGLGVGPAPGTPAGRAPAGTLPGQGPAAQKARALTGPSLPAAGPPLDTRTMKSAEEEAQSARALASGGMDVTKLSAEQIAQKYGSLPLILPTGKGPFAKGRAEEEPTMPGADEARRRRPQTGTVVLDPGTPPARREESVADFQLEELDIDEIPTAEAADPLEPLGLDEITRRVRTGVRIEDVEDALPIPDIPLDDEPTKVGPTPANAPFSAAPWGSLRKPPPNAAGALLGSEPPKAPFAPRLSPAPFAASPAPIPISLGAPSPEIRTAPEPAFAAPFGAAPGAPLLVDVTPLTLAVETVSGYCDAVIERNTPVPCERTRAFVTAADNQTTVKVRVSQGESSRFGDNTLLGEVELIGLRAAPRGQVQIAVSFALDTDGLLNVSATDVETGRAAATRVRLIGIPEAADVERMAARQAAIAM
jgi:molecular chaperone DnaK